ncbi:TRM11 family SAM-dependent methyltransferase [Flammeovirga kamogawensis]|uniref:Methyltransferase n=1 Tax=Flammeovirga kamogawensis TaxID=373891 RepID=A0ABX8GUC3_9BACT|nr:methyltransferase [Flammeovirga kamogawensis]MBB6460069.1 tRNA G10 N-methylase Trm11 [Flammeovirga kamogawensis]QWG06887.1 methyltransferase [Flammeovirga kamogawensis]TRX68709.1 methyltransferase [Flammeovirga kamogawensis]
MQQQSHIYSLNFNFNESQLSKLESKYLFNEEVKGKLLFSDIKIEPSCSPFIKKRLDIQLASKDYKVLMDQIEAKKIKAEGFKVEYLMLEGDTIGYPERLGQLRDIGYRIEGEPDYYHPTITYGLCFFEETWYFGPLIKNNPEWQNHNKKPCSFSNSLSINTAKSLVNIAAKGNKNSTLIDACCGVGTVLLEACFAGYSMDGCDINHKACNNAKKNLAHYNYTANVFNSDIKDITKQYDAAIIDLPYNLYSYSTEDIASNIIKSAAQITNRIVVVSISDIEDFIKNAGFTITDFCTIDKIGKVKFIRNIWVCEKEPLKD